ncbi:MAG: hypothetical protein LBP73_10135 [Clostridiales Family XIII bacterium]|jgi:hypothetical protein|nr:hypothetical protein [Clostridiales Family XIII bacterium]
MKTKQVKIYAEPELADAFKALCEKGGTSVTAELSAYMRKRTHLKEPSVATGNRADRRWRRKATVRRMISPLEKVRDAEESYRDSIPENLCGGPLLVPGACERVAEAADEAIARLTEAVDALSEAHAL